MNGSHKIAVGSLTLSIIACLLAGAVWWTTRKTVESTPRQNAGWLAGTSQEKFAQVERHLRGLDQAMAEIGYRYGELLVAGKERNWDYARYQTEKIDLALRLALERRPKRAQSAQPFLNESLPAVIQAIESRDDGRLDGALDQLHNSCVECHRSENVLYFRDAVGRIRDNALK
ncbi:MAG: hypothetical protein L0229_14015 [Blastocatellia bacterium]|nr:hypothetical protein [Blastocatellia bacterium]